MNRPPHRPGSIPDLIGRLLCLLDMHDYVVIEVTMGFGSTGSVAKLQCERCHEVTTRSG